MRITLINPVQAHAAFKAAWIDVKAKLMAGHKIEIEVRDAEDSKTDRQRRYYHGCILKTIASHATANGQKFDLRVWKEHFRAEFLGFKTRSSINPMTGKKVRRRERISSEDLGVKAYNALIERVTAFAVTELGIEFPAEWRDPETGEIYQ